MAKRVVLAYSGGLDTSVAVRWMTEEMGVEVIALAADLGQGGDWDAVTDRALAAGAVEVVIVDVREEFGADFVAPGYPGQRILRGQIPAYQLAFSAHHRETPRGGGSPARRRRDRPRLHGQGQRPGTFRSLEPRPGPGPRSDRAGARLGLHA